MKLYIVGAGPGDPDLITVKGLKLLQSADVVLYTDSLVNDELVAKAKPGAEVLQSSGMALEEMVGLLVDRIRQGKRSCVCTPAIRPCTERRWNKSHC